MLVDDIVGIGQLKDKVKIRYDDINRCKFVCDADVWTSLSTPKRKIRKIARNIEDRWTTQRVANGGEYNLRATDLTTVRGYIYS